MKKSVIVFSLTTILFSLTSCFSTYPIQKKYPCQETTVQEKLVMIEEAYNSRMKPKSLNITDKGVSVGKMSYEFENIRYVRAKTKPGFLFLYKKYWIQIREFNGDMNIIYLRDHAIMEKANNALMCLTALQETDGRPPKKDTSITPKSNKYDDLEKLKKILESGAITQEEYEKEKEKILNK